MMPEQMTKSETEVHPKDRGLFTKIDAALAEYECHAVDEVPAYLERNQTEVDAIREHVALVRDART